MRLERVANKSPFSKDIAAEGIVTKGIIAKEFGTEGVFVAKQNRLPNLKCN